MKKFMRGISRALLHVVVMSLVPIELVYPRAYMRLFCWLLAKYGLRLEGRPRYISSRARFDDFNLVSIGERSVISKYVILLTHDYSLTTALICIGEKPQTDISIRRGIVIGANVFVGMNSLLLPGTRIGDNVIIGAGSVVRGVVPPDSIVLGNPAKRIGSLAGKAEYWRFRRSGEEAHADFH